MDTTKTVTKIFHPEDPSDRRLSDLQELASDYAGQAWVLQ